MDNIAALQHKGFTIEPSKGSVERGQTKAISISWTPIDFDVGAWEPFPPGEGWGLQWVRWAVPQKTRACCAP